MAGVHHPRLTRRGTEPFKDLWDAPGGFVDVGESLEEGLRRELRAKLGVEIQIWPVLGSDVDTFGRASTPILAIFFLATIREGTPLPSGDVATVHWFARDRIPPVAFASTQRALEAWLAGHWLRPAE